MFTDKFWESYLKVFAPDKESHLPVLDGMRGMAVLMVMVSHFLQIVAGPASPYGTHLAASLPRFPQLGQKGVDLFFVLTILVSQISQVAFERPILKLKDYFQYEDKSAPLAKSPRLAAAPQ